MARWKGPVTAAVIVAVLAAAVMLVFRFVDDERERALLNWQTRMAIVADSRVAAIEDWLRDERAAIERVASGTTAPLYVMQILDAPEGEARAEAQFLRNLLEVTASQAGYELPAAGPDVNANVERVARAGIAIVGRDGRMIARTRAMPPIDAALRRFLGTVENPGAHLYDLHESAAGEVSVGFVAPIYRVQSDPEPGNIIAYVVALKPVAETLFPLLRQPGATDETAEALLVRRDGPAIRYLSPMQDGTAALERQMALDTPRLASAFAIATPGGFGEYRDYRGEDVLALSRPLEGAPWTLLYKIDRDEALAGTETRLQRLLIILLLAVGLAAAAAFGLWRHGASRRASEAAARATEAAQRLEAQRNVLRVVSDNQPNGIAVFDPDDVYRFANQTAAERAGMAKEDMIGKSMAAVLGADRARRYELLNREAAEAGEPITALHRLGGSEERIYQSKHVPFPGTDDIPSGVMLVEEDVTDALVERERRERNLQQVVEGLLTLVDQRDPNAANHSLRVGMVGQGVAREMGYDEVTAETARFAGELMNVGKIMVPEDLLTKPGKLTKGELKRVHDALDLGADLLSGIEFDGPVVETLRQARERVDGSGPRKLAGEDILPTARIVAVANALVAMISPRAHREGMSIDAAMAALQRDAGTVYDRKVLTALANYLDNRGGREALAEEA